MEEKKMETTKEEYLKIIQVLEVLKYCELSSLETTKEIHKTGIKNPLTVFKQLREKGLIEKKDDHQTLTAEGEKQLAILKQIVNRLDENTLFLLSLN